MPDDPFVQQFTSLLDDLPVLSVGARLAVLSCIGLFMADPCGPTARDIQKYAGLSEPTVRKTLGFLEHHRFVQRDAEGRYRPLRHYSYRGPAPLELRSPDGSDSGSDGGGGEGGGPSPGTKKVSARTKKVFVSRPRRRNRNQPELPLENSSSLSAAQKVLFEAGIFSAGEITIDEAGARAVAAAISAGDVTAGFAYTCLKNDGRWRPTAERRPLTRGDFNDWEWERMMPENQERILRGDLRGS